MTPPSPIARHRRRLALALLAIVVGVIALAPGQAQAGRYTVAQCDRANRAYPDAVFERVYGGDYSIAFRCAEDEDGNSLQIHAVTGSPQNRYGQISWAAPPGARIMAIDLEAKLRSNAGHQSRLSFLDGAGNEVGRIATGADSAASFESYRRSLSDGGRERFAATLACPERNGCRFSDVARTSIRSVRLTIDDRVAPGAYFAGSLLTPGWRRASQALFVGASDAGSGVQSINVRVNGVSVAPSRSFACATIPGTALASRTQPCPAAQLLGTTFDTTTGPFVNGDNSVSVCASDFGSGGAPGCTATAVKIDNAPPEAAFSSAQDVEDPELIRAPVADRHSGVAGGSISYRPLDGGAWRELPTRLGGGELQARVDSSSEPAGRYLFRVSAGDVAGNAMTSSARADGSQMVLTFPLRQATSLQASIDGDRSARVRYSHQATLEGILRDSAGEPLASQPLDVVETFAAGSSLAPIGHSLVSDSRGRFTLKLSRGPSRRVSVGYAGSRRYLAAPSASLDLAVEGAANLRKMRKRIEAGRKVVFHGTVGVFGVAMERGKLVELQVKGGGIRRYRTVRQAFRTNARGEWNMRYRFARFYRRPTKFRFRVKVTPEARWPYLAPTASRSRVLKVVPRKRRGG